MAAGTGGASGDAGALLAGRGRDSERHAHGARGGRSRTARLEALRGEDGVIAGHGDFTRRSRRRGSHARAPWAPRVGVLGGAGGWARRLRSGGAPRCVERWMRFSGGTRGSPYATRWIKAHLRSPGGFRRISERYPPLWPSIPVAAQVLTWGSGGGATTCRRRRAWRAPPDAGGHGRAQPAWRGSGASSGRPAPRPRAR